MGSTLEWEKARSASEEGLPRSGFGLGPWEAAGPRRAAYLLMSFSPFSTTGLTFTLAGFAFTSIISPGLNGFGFRPAFVAGFFTSFSLTRPGITNSLGPFFLRSSDLIRSSSASKTAATCFGSRLTFSAISLYTWDLGFALGASDVLLSAIAFLARYGGNRVNLRVTCERRERAGDRQSLLYRNNTEILG